MTEEHAADCTSVETDDKDANEDPAKETLGHTDATDSEPICANNTKDGSAINRDAYSDVEEYVDAEDTRATLSWTLEANEFKVSWSLPEGVATPKDCIGICAGE